MIPDPALLVAAVETRLMSLNTTTTRLDVFVGEPTAVMDSDGRAHPYTAIYPSPGQALRRPMAGTATELLWSFQTTCAGGDPTRALRAIQRVRDRLDGHRLTIDGLIVGVLREQEFYEPGPLRPDKDVSPPRWWAPLMWDLHATSNPAV